MSVNSSSTSFLSCFDSVVSLYISIAYFLTKLVLVLPFVVLVLYLGLRRWWRQRQGTLTTTSHSDVFIYHVCIFEFIFVIGSVFLYCGWLSGLSEMMSVGLHICTVSFPGPILLHIMTCVDRYLAVVYPVTYLRLRQSGGVKIRITSTFCVWLLSSGLGSVGVAKPDFYFFVLLGFFAVSIVIISLFSLQVLCALNRPGPAEVRGRGEREQVDQSKKRVSHIVMAITGAVWMWLIGSLLPIILRMSHLVSDNDGCLLLICGYWFSLPSNLVLPLLYLQRAGKQTGSGSFCAHFVCLPSLWNRLVFCVTKLMVVWIYFPKFWLHLCLEGQYFVLHAFLFLFLLVVS